jgi:nucleotide-binding universal stress UspA family protein
MKILLAIDGSTHSDRAVEQVASQPWPPHTTVGILTVIHSTIPMLTEPTLMVAAASVQQAEQLRAAAPAVVDSARTVIVRSAPGLTVTTKVVDGAPAHSIVDEARAWGADLIVLGSHGYGFITRMILGSVAGAVVANAPCSVQVVRQRAQDGAASANPGHLGGQLSLRTDTQSIVVERVRAACLDATLVAYEDAGIRGLCAEGRWEAAVAAIRHLDLSSVLEPPPDATRDERT